MPAHIISDNELALLAEHTLEIVGRA